MPAPSAPPSPGLPDNALNKSQKFVRLLEALQEPGGASATVLMERFGLDDRGLRRYLSDLRDLGLPLQSDGRGHERRLWLDASYRRQRVQVSLLEMISLRFGRAAFHFLEGTGFAQDMDDALEVLSSLGGDGFDGAKNLDRKFIALPEHRKDHTRDADHIDELISALVYDNPILAHYAKVGGRTRRYSLEPLTLAIYKQGLYLFARDREEDKIKTYAVDRFRSIQRRRGEHFEYPPDYRPDALYADAFGIIGGTVADVVLHFNRRASPYVVEREWHASQQIRALSDAGVELQMHVSIGHELKSWVLGFGPDVQVIAPTTLRDEIQRLHREAADQTDPSRHGRPE